jgi:hypothetical protein
MFANMVPPQVRGVLNKLKQLVASKKMEVSEFKKLLKVLITPTKPVTITGSDGKPITVENPRETALNKKLDNATMRDFMYALQGKDAPGTLKDVTSSKRHIDFGDLFKPAKKERDQTTIFDLMETGTKEDVDAVIERLVATEEDEYDLHDILKKGFGGGRPFDGNYTPRTTFRRRRRRLGTAKSTTTRKRPKRYTARAGKKVNIKIIPKKK